jgi:hypothetical protein
MPLRVTNGIPITPKPPAPETGPSGAVLFDLSNMAPANATTTAPTTVPVTLGIGPVVQQQSEWCWAACVEMVLTHYQIHAAQCAIVDKKRSFAATVNGAPGPCCGNEARFQLETCNVDDIDDVWGKFGLTATPRGNPQSGEVTFQMIKDEIDARRPVEVAIRWHLDRPGGHAVLIVGWTTVNGQEAVLVNDPLPTAKMLLDLKGQSGTITMSDLQKASGHGTWEKTWIEIQPGGNNG